MRFVLFFSTLIILFSCNSPFSRKNTPATSAVSAKGHKTIFRKIFDSIYPEPNPVFLRGRLFAFFDRHKNEDVFDTIDNTYQEYWGVANYGDYAVTAGHLFNDKQVHAMIMYADYNSTKMFIYLKKNGSWEQIFADTSIENMHAYPELKDWNNDGVKDIVMPFQSSWTDVVELWLIDKSGERVHYVQDFAAVANPVLDSVTGIISSGYEHAGGGSYHLYKFSNYRLQEIEGVGVWFNNERMDTCSVTFYKNGKEVKEIRVPSTAAYKYVPERWKTDVEAYFSN